MLAIAASWALGRLRALWSIICDHPLPCACWGLLLACVWLWHGEQSAKREVSLVRAALDSAHKASVAELTRATAERDAAIKHEKEQNDATDQRVAAARVDDSRHLADYIGRLRAAKYQGDGGSLPPSGKEDMAQGGNRPGGTSELDARLNTDLEICTVNTRRLLEIHNEAVTDSPQSH